MGRLNSMSRVLSASDRKKSMIAIVVTVPNSAVCLGSGRVKKMITNATVPMMSQCKPRIKPRRMGSPHSQIPFEFLS